MNARPDPVRSALCGLGLLLSVLYAGCGDDADAETRDREGDSGPNIDGRDADGRAGSGNDGGAQDSGAGDASAGASAAGASGGNAGRGGAGNAGRAGNAGGSGSSGSGSGAQDSGAGMGSAQDGGDGGPSGPFDAACFGGGDRFEPSSGQTGACAAPFVVDLRDADFGDVLLHETNAAPNSVITSVGKCGELTERDLVYQVRVPSEADLEISVQAADDADPIILVQDGPDTTCEKASSIACVDDSGEGECEYLHVRTSQGGFDESTAQVVIAETIASGAELSVRFRLKDPQGGS